MSKILITGSNGYIGSHVVTKFIDMGHEVIACDLRFDRVDSRAKYCDIPIFSADKNIYQALESPEYLIHLAWNDGFFHNSMSHIENLYKHYEFLVNMINGGLKNISIMGTMHEVGYYEGCICDNTPTNPMSLYGISKNALRQSMALICREKKISLRWLRAFYIYGDDLFSNSIFSKIMQLNKEGKKTFPFNSGNNAYDFIRVENLAEQICMATMQDKILEIINCCSGEATPLGEMVDRFIEEHKLNIKPNYGEFLDRPYDAKACWGDNSKILKILERAGDR